MPQIMRPERPQPDRPAVPEEGRGDPAGLPCRGGVVVAEHLPLPHRRLDRGGVAGENLTRPGVEIDNMGLLGLGVSQDRTAWASAERNTTLTLATVPADNA